jgi:hypothetical protein
MSRQQPAEGFVLPSTNDPGADMAETTERILDGQDEQAKVESWRLHVLMEGGYPLPLAEKLAASEADLHAAVELLAQGCDPATAAEILL